MYTFNRIGISFCVLRMLKIFSQGREQEVEGDDSRVVVAVGNSKQHNGEAKDQDTLGLLKLVQHHLSYRGMTCFGQLNDFLTNIYSLI